MYLIIIEGTDNIGKDTLLNRLTGLFEIVTLIHCGGPKSKIFKNQEQDRHFIQYAKNIVNGVYDNTDCIIMNRAHYGEYVYGQIYRQRTNIDIMDMINEFDAIISNDRSLMVKYIQLVSTSVELRKKNDDNKSMSKMDEEKMKLETELFLKIFNYSKLDKKLIYVNDGDNFRSKDDIYNEAIEFLNT